MHPFNSRLSPNRGRAGDKNVEIPVKQTDEVRQETLLNVLFRDHDCVQRDRERLRVRDHSVGWSGIERILQRARRVVERYKPNLFTNSHLETSLSSRVVNVRQDRYHGSRQELLRGRSARSGRCRSARALGPQRRAGAGLLDEPTAERQGGVLLVLRIPQTLVIGILQLGTGYESGA